MTTNTKRRESLMRVKEVPHELGQHPATIYRKVHDGSLPAVRLGAGRAAIASTPASSKPGSRLVT